jgi:hypothetical protein
MRRRLYIARNPYPSASERNLLLPAQATTATPRACISRMGRLRCFNDAPCPPFTSHGASIMNVTWRPQLAPPCRPALGWALRSLCGCAGWLAFKKSGLARPAELGALWHDRACPSSPLPMQLLKTGGKSQTIQDFGLRHIIADTSSQKRRSISVNMPMQHAPVRCATVARTSTSRKAGCTHRHTRLRSMYRPSRTATAIPKKYLLGHVSIRIGIAKRRQISVNPEFRSG